MKSTLKQLNFITGNYKNLSDSLAIERLFKQVFDATFDKKVGTSTKDGRVNGNGFYIDYSKTINQNVTLLKEYLNKKGVTLEEYLVYLNCFSLFNWYWFRKEKGNYYISSNGNSCLIHFIKFLHVGRFDKDLQKTNELMKQNGIRHSSESFKLTIGNITVQVYKNGRCDLKGLTDKQRKEIDKMIELKNKLGRN